MANGLILLAMLSVLDGTSWQGADNAALKIKFADEKATGSLGCNTFRAQYLGSDSSIAFSNILTTRKGCAPAIMKQENAWLKMLDQTTSFVVEGDQLLLKDANGIVIGRLLRI